MSEGELGKRNHLELAEGSSSTSFPGSLFFPPPRARERERETLVWSGHVGPKIWDVTNKRLVGGADEFKICPYLAQGRAVSV